MGENLKSIQMFLWMFDLFPNFLKCNSNFIYKYASTDHNTLFNTSQFFCSR